MNNSMAIGSVRTLHRNIVSRQYTGPAKIFVRKVAPNNYTIITLYRDQPMFAYTARTLPSWVWLSPAHAWIGQPWSTVQILTANAVLAPNTPRRN
jgi:hypothetical protein